MHTQGVGFIVESGEAKPVGRDGGAVANVRIGVHGARAQVGENDDGTPKYGRETLYYRATGWDELAGRLAKLNPGDQFEFSGRVRAPKPYEKDGETVYPDKTLDLVSIDFTPRQGRSRSAGATAEAAAGTGDSADQTIDPAVEDDLALEHF